MINKLFLFACLPLFFAACSEKTVEQEPSRPRPVKIMQVGASDARGVLELPGSVYAARETQVAFEVSGRIIEILVEEGDQVIAGAVIAKLDPRDFEAARDSALARRNSARADYSRYVDANKANAVTRQSVDLAKRNLDVAEADLKTALKALEDTVLKAPYDGRIAMKTVEEFSNIQAKQSVVTIHDESSLEVRVNIAERDWVAAPPNLSAAHATELLAPSVELSALPGRLFDAQAKSYSTAVDPITRTYEASFSFEAPKDRAISPGMTAKVRIRRPSTLIEGTDKIYIPASAVFSKSDGQPSVWLIDENNRTVKQNVTLGPVVGGQVSLSDGLQPGAKIATSGVHTITEGMHVRPLNP